MSEIKRLLNALLWEIYGRIPSTILRRQRKSELMKMHPKLYEPRLLAKLNTKVLKDICGILQLEIRLMSKYLERVLISRDKNRTQQTILYGFLGVIVSSRLGESSREMRFTVSPPPGIVKGRAESGRTTTVEETTSSSDFSQWLHAMKMVARLPGGMPPEFRRKLWLALAEKYLKSKNVDWEKEEEKCFSEQWREDDEELGIQIVKDLHRTGSSLCSGPAGTINQAKLKRILLGYARYNPEVGYCQGFNMLGALILQVMDKEEIESIKVMIYLVEGILPRGYFSGSLGGLQADMAVFRELMTSKLPRLAKHLQKLQGPVENAFEPPLTNVFTMQWFLTMFCTCLPMTCVLRVWDLVLIEGSDVLLRTALVLWSLLEERILCAKTADDFYCKMGSFSSELLNGHLIDSNGLIEKVVDLGPVPDLQKMRDKHLYNISPFRDKKGLQLYYSDEEGDSDEDSRMAVATAWGLRLSRRGSAGLSSKADGKDRIALDISLLKKQYDRLRERQRQAHIILTSAVARQGSNPNQSSIQMNQLLIGRNAIVTNHGRRIGPPQGAIPPARKPSLPTAKSSKLVQSKPLRRGETLHWRDTDLSKRRRGSVKWKDIKPNSPQTSQDDRTPQLIDSAPSSRSSSSEPKSQRNSFKTHQRSDSSSYSEDSDGNSSTSTSLCDEDDHEVGDNNLSSLEASPLKKSKSSKKHSEGSHKKRLDDVLKGDGKQHTTHIDSQIPFVQLTTMGSPLQNANKTDIDSLEYGKEDSETESNRLEYAGFVDEYSWPDINAPATTSPLADLKIDVTSHDTDYLSLPNAITSTSQLSPIADISTYIKSSTISPLRTPISAFNYSNLVRSSDDPKDFNVNDEGVTNEYFERINIVERPTKLDLLYSLNEEDSIRNAFKSCEVSPEEESTNNESAPLERTKQVANENTEMTTHPFTEEVDRKMKVLLEYSNQSSLSFIAEAKHEISSGLFKDKEFEIKSLKMHGIDSVSSVREKDTSDETTDLFFPLSTVDSKVDDFSPSYTCKDADGIRCDSEISKQNVSENIISQDLLAPNSTSLKTEHSASTSTEVFKAGIRTQLKDSLEEEFSRTEKDLVKDDIKKTEEESNSIPTTENLENRFRALELSFIDRKESTPDTIDFKTKILDAREDDLTQSSNAHHESSPSEVFSINTGELEPRHSDTDVLTTELDAPESLIEGADAKTNFQFITDNKKDLYKEIQPIHTEISGNDLEVSDKKDGLVVEQDASMNLEDESKNNHSFPIEITNKYDSGKEFNDEDGKVEKVTLSFGQENSIVTQASDTEQPANAEDTQAVQHLSMDIPQSILQKHQKEQSVDKKVTNDSSMSSYCVESKCSPKPEMDLNEFENLSSSKFKDLSSGNAATSYHFVPTLDIERTAIASPETRLLSPSFLKKHFNEKEALEVDQGSLHITKQKGIEDHELKQTKEVTTVNFQEKETPLDRVPNVKHELRQTKEDTTEDRSVNFQEKETPLDRVPNLLEIKPAFDSKNEICKEVQNTSLDFGNSRGEEPAKAEIGTTRKSKIPSTEDLESRFMALERQFSDKSISLQKDPIDPSDNKLKSPIKDKDSLENAKAYDPVCKIEISTTPENISPKEEDQTKSTYVKIESQKKTIPTTADLEHRYEQLERKLSEHNVSAPNTTQAEVSNKRNVLSDNENHQTPKSPSEKLTEPPYIRKRIPSTEDLENRFKALEIQKALKSPTATTSSLLSPLSSSISQPFSKCTSDDSSNVPTTEALESRFKALETSKQIQNILKEDVIGSSSVRSESGIPSTRDLENRFDALEQQKKDNERKLKVREKKTELNSESNSMVYSVLEDKIPIDTPPAGEKDQTIRERDDETGQTERMSSNFKHLGEEGTEQSKDEPKKLPSTRDLELRFDAFERSKLKIESHGSSNDNLELKSSKDIMNENKKQSKHIPSTQDLETRFKILEGNKLQQANENQVGTIEKTKEGEKTTSVRPLSQALPASLDIDSIPIDESRRFSDPQTTTNPKDLQIIKYEPIVPKSDQNQQIESHMKSPNVEQNEGTSSPPKCSEITISFKRKDLYKLESQSDETLTATDPTSTEFDTKTESRPTSCPEYNDSIDSNTVNTDRVLKIIEENSKILHRILKKTLADAGNIETNTQHKRIHPGITDSLLALGNIFPRSDETISSSGTKSQSSYRSCITLHSDDNISDRLASIKSTIKSIDTLCEEKSFRKDKCQRYIDSLFAHSKISTTILNPSIKVEDFESNTSQNRVTKRELKKDISPRRRRDEEREEYESRVRRDMMPNSLDASSENSCSLASFDVDNEVDRINKKKAVDTVVERSVSPYYGSGYELNKRSVTPVVYIPTKLEIRHTTVTSTFYDRYLTEKEIEKTFPKSKKSPVSPTITKSYLDISKYSSINLNDRNSKSAENSPSRRKDTEDLFIYEKSPSANKKNNLTSTLNVAQKDLHIQSCDNILLRLQSSTHHKDVEPSVMVYKPLQRKPPDLGISLGLYKDYGSDESTKS